MAIISQNILLNYIQLNDVLRTLLLPINELFLLHVCFVHAPEQF